MSQYVHLEYACFEMLSYKDRASSLGVVNAPRDDASLYPGRSS